MNEDPDIIDGGDWPAGDDVQPVEGKARRVEDTRANLAFCLFGLLAATVVGLLLLLWLGKLDADDFAQVAGLMISPLVGLVGAVTGYYYGKSDR